jgi:hypothetical protein
MDHRPADSLPRRFRLTRPHAKRPALPSPYFSPTSKSLHPIAHPPHKSHPSYRSHFPRRPSTLPMPGPTSDQLRAQLDIIYRTESRRILATLIRLLGDFELAEDALHDAFSAALEQGPVQGIPANPRAWLVSGRPVQSYRCHSTARPIRGNLGLQSQTNSKPRPATLPRLTTKSSRMTGFG